MNEDTDNEARIASLILREDQWALRQILGLCPWAAGAHDGLEEILPATFPLVDGRNIYSETLARWSEGLIRLIKTFDWHEGWRPLSQNLSPRFFEEDLVISGQVFPALDREERHGRLKIYFSKRGWRDDGRPFPEL